MNRPPALFFAADKGGGVQPSALDQNPPLFFLEGEKREAVRKANGEYSGDEFFAERPADYQRIVDKLGRGDSLRTIVEAVRPCSINTVRAIRRREGLPIDTARAKTVEAITEFVLDSAHRLRDEALPIASVPVAFGIAVEKLQLLTGGATARVETVDVTPGDDFAAYIDALPSMGLGAEESGQKGVEIQPIETSSDTQSPVSTFNCENATHLATQSAAITGGGGGEICPPPPIMPIHLSERESETKSPPASTAP